MPFKKGQSGNPAGKPKGAKDKRTELRALLQSHEEALIAKAVALALEGDTTALRLCLDRLVAPLRPTDRAISLASFGGALGDRCEQIMAALGRGDLTPDEAGTIMQSVAAHARIIEVDDLERRVAELERRQGGKHVAT